jgi:RNA polymerase sigma factor FliA
MNATAAEQHKLMESHQGLVRSLAMGVRSKAAPHVDLEDLVAYGQVGLAEASRDFDPGRGTQFSTFAYYRIRGAIYDGLAQMRWGGKTPGRRARYERMAHQVLAERQADSESDDPDMTAGEMASTQMASAQASAGGGSGTSTSGASRAASGSAGSSSSNSSADPLPWLSGTVEQLAVVYLASDMQEGDYTAQAVDPHEPTPEVEAADREVRGRLRAEVATLPPVMAQLVQSVYFEGVTLQEAARRQGMSKSWASRLHAKALQLLAHRLASVR